MDFSRLYKQDVVYWPPGISDGRGGFTYTSTPTSMKCRIVMEEIKGVNPGGISHIVQTELQTNIEIEDNGRIYVGSAVDLPSVDPMDSSITTYNLMKVSKIPSIDNRQSIYKGVLENA